MLTPDDLAAIALVVRTELARPRRRPRRASPTPPKPLGSPLAPDLAAGLQEAIAAVGVDGEASALAIVARLDEDPAALPLLRAAVVSVLAHLRARRLSAQVLGQTLGKAAAHPVAGSLRIVRRHTTTGSLWRVEPAA
jgi:hypothetical protein